MVDRLITLGARHVDIGQSSDDDHVVLADPEGNEFCVVLRGEFLATTQLLGAVVFEPAAPVVGRFWSEATGWPMVYDQDGDTAIRAPDGRGPFVTFGPPNGSAKTGKNRLHLDIAPPAAGDQAAEVERLIGLGARRVRHRTGRRFLGGDGRSRGQRVLRPDSSLRLACRCQLSGPIRRPASSDAPAPLSSKLRWEGKPSCPAARPSGSFARRGGANPPETRGVLAPLPAQAAPGSLSPSRNVRLER